MAQSITSHIGLERVPSTSSVFRALLRADTVIAWRERRSLLMTFALPVIFVITWRSLIPTLGGIAVLAISITIGLPAVGLMSYPMSVARDRERGVFQRMRATPIPVWTIMASRLVVQTVVIVLMTVISYVAAVFVDQIVLPPGNVVLMVIAATLGGISFLGLGQLVVGYVKGSESVNAVVRLLYFPFAILGAIGEAGLFGTIVKKIVDWSPFGTTQTIMSAAMGGRTAADVAFLALILTIAYGAAFAAIGIRKFRWSVS